MKKLASILLTLAVMVSLLVVPAVVADTIVEGTTYEIVGGYYPVDFTVTDDGPTVTWTFDTVGEKDLVGDGHWGYGLAISLDGEKPVFQIHNNDGTIGEFPYGTHLYSPYLDGWVSGTTNTLVSELDWVTCTGDRDIVNNTDGIFTVTIDKDELGLEFYWAIWFGVGGFYNPNNGYSSYPEGFMWDENVTAGHYELYSFPVNTSVGLTADTVEITAISVTPTDISFGTVGPGESVSGINIAIENIGAGNIDIDANLDRDGTVFDYLQLNGAYSSGYSGDWPSIIKGLGPSESEGVSTGLKVPPTYSAQGPEDAILLFTATA